MTITQVEAQFAPRLDAVAAALERLLDRLLTALPQEGERLRPARLLEAVRYAVLGGGKRLRPFLVVESANLFAVAQEQALMVGAALECVHGYSLVHDDLPAMDNDALRRGRPTVHKAFDEATAILAGDSLLTFAFESSRGLKPTPIRRCASAWSARWRVLPGSAEWPGGRCWIWPPRAGFPTCARL